MLIKICGITRPEDAEVAAAAGADLVGLVFVPGTPRAVDPDDVRGWVSSLAGVEVAGVFRDAELSDVLEVRRALGLDWVQLHGSEPDGFLDVLGANVLRRVAVDADGIDWVRVTDLARRCLPLIDPGAGDGRAFDWRLLDACPEEVRYGLAGGLTPATVAEAIRVANPVLVDVSSGVESAPGVKDPEKVREFVEAARSACGGAGRG